jgi:hypothetical protein
MTLPLLLLGSSMIAVSGVVGYVSGKETAPPYGPGGWWTVSSMVSTMPITAGVMVLSDVVSQGIEKFRLASTGQPKQSQWQWPQISEARFDWRRCLTSSIIGVFAICFLFGSIWLHYIDFIFPPAEVCPSNPNIALGLLILVAKSAFDSFAYGTISNSLIIFTRRLVAGDTAAEAFSTWEELIIDVSLCNFGFWTFWKILTYSIVPDNWRVAMVSLGSFIWNTYLGISCADQDFENVESVGHPTPRRFGSTPGTTPLPTFRFVKSSTLLVR